MHTVNFINLFHYTILVASSALLPGNNMLGRLTIKAVNSWLGYKISELIMLAMEVLYKNAKLFHNRFKVLENTIVVLEKAAFNYPQALKTKINGHHGNLDILYTNFQQFSTVTSKKFFRTTGTLNNDQFVV